MCLVVYLTCDYKSKYRLYKNIPILEEIGSTNGYGWEIVNIQVIYKKRFYSLKAYMEIEEEKEKQRIKKTFPHEPFSKNSRYITKCLKSLFFSILPNTS